MCSEGWEQRTRNHDYLAIMCNEKTSVTICSYTFMYTFSLWMKKRQLITIHAYQYVFFGSKNFTTGVHCCNPLNSHLRFPIQKAVSCNGQAKLLRSSWICDAELPPFLSSSPKKKFNLYRVRASTDWLIDVDWPFFCAKLTTNQCKSESRQNNDSTKGYQLWWMQV